MAYLPVDGSTIYSVYNPEIWTKQGTAFLVGGGFTTVSGTVSQQLLASSNTTQGYFNGQMLAYASGVISGGGASGLTAGAVINFDPSSPSGDTGQKVWNQLIICDPSLKFILPLLDPVTGAAFVPLNTIQVAGPKQGWVIRQQYLYAGGTPATDVAAVQTAVAAAGVSQSQVMNSSNANEVIFAY